MTQRNIGKGFRAHALYSHFIRKAFASIRKIRKGIQHSQRIHNKLIVSFVRNSQGFVRNSQAFVTICKASLVSVILLGNRIIVGEFAANINVLHSQGYSPLCERRINLNVAVRKLQVANQERMLIVRRYIILYRPIIDLTSVK